MSVWSHEGRNVLVVGCYSGIGRATAEELVRLGARVHGMDWKSVDGIGLSAFTLCDLRDTGSIDAALGQIAGPLDAIYYCSGLPQTHPAMDVLKVNFINARYFIERARPLVRDGGAIAIIASTAGNGWVTRAATVTEFVTTSDGSAAVAWAEPRLAELGDPYSFSKEAIIVWAMRESARIAENRGIRLNLLSPGPTISGMTPDFDSFAGAKVIDVYTQPLGRRSAPEEQAFPLIFLNSEGASYINGCNFITDAGFTAGMATGQIALDRLLAEAVA
ncbi:NAD(P)-dependent dehydrogenase, short-chain alcohol dehydrogenase family [Sphingomonas laterariae]|uniref:NAD(P)-dependent dehydrogenase, short-chain alcohol dehydrogenase family n=1 Tax=Edaphosphingomonas laterariae TaxID=861865 RepID=A0A239BDB9_9SPHN|nr:SDR family oxidoreductase [Sphingomonas laterariae]SNS05388.1 NAD(P)-dependent dehydrogenase, short-chain alcohol dehydrogenase family [Sphingomonas laterariae]